MPTAFLIIRALMQRSEFNLEFMADNTTVTSLKSLSPMQGALARRYYALFVQTFHWVAVRMQGLTELPRDPMHLFGEVLALSYIRIPAVQELVIKYITTQRFQPTKVPIDSAFILLESKAESDAGIDIDYELPLEPPVSLSKTARTPTSLKPTSRKLYHYQPLSASQNAAYNKFITAHSSLFKWNLFESEYDGGSLLPATEDWIQKLLIDAEFFCIFFRYLCLHITSLTDSNYDTNWDAIPGYHDLVDLWLLSLDLCCTQVG